MAPLESRATMHIDPVAIARTALQDSTAGGGSALDHATGVTAVILAAGHGTRLGLGCKPLAIVGGVTLLERAVATARGAGIARVMVIVASPDGSVASFCRANLPAVEVALASDSARGNGASAAAGLGHAGGRCLVMMVDHLHATATLERLMGADGDFVLAIDSRRARRPAARARAGRGGRRGRVRCGSTAREGALPGRAPLRRRAARRPRAGGRRRGRGHLAGDGDDRLAVRDERRVREVVE